MKGNTSRLFGLLLAASMVISFLPSCGQANQFQVGAVTVTPTKTANGAPVAIDVNITNTAQSPGTFKAILNINGKTVDSQDISFTAGEQKPVSFRYIPDTAGQFTAEISGVSAQFEVVKAAEFQVLSVDWPVEEFVAGKPFTVKAQVKNASEINGNYSARLVSDGNELARIDIPVAKGATEPVTLSGAFKTPGPHTMEFGSFKKEVIARKAAEISALGITVTPGTIFPGQEATVEAQVKNIGETAEPTAAILTLNGVETDYRFLTLGTGATANVTFPIARDAAGTYNLGVGGKTVPLTVADVKTYNSDDFYYSFAYPSSWVMNDTEQWDLTAGVKDGPGIHVDIWSLSPPNIALSEFVKFSNGRDDKLAYNIQTVSETNLVQGYGAENPQIYQQEYTYTQNGTAMHGKRIKSRSGRYGYIFETQCPESQWAGTLPVLDACIESFKSPLAYVQDYTDTTHGFSLSLPTNWDAVETDNIDMPVEIRNPAGEAGVYCWVTTEFLSENKTVKDYALAAAARYSKRPGYAIYSQKDVKFAGLIGYQVVFDFKTTNMDNQYRFCLTSVIRGSQALAFYGYGLLAKYNAVQKDIDFITNSFTLSEPKPFGVSRQESLFLYNGQILTLDPALTNDSPAGICGAIYSGLTRLDKDLKPVPEIAESWDLSPDGKTYTFHLRKNAAFHDGKPVTARDFMYAWERACDPATRSNFARTYLGDIVGAIDMLEGKAKSLSGVNAIDEYTLAVTIDSPKPYFLAKLAQPVAFVLDRASVTRGASWTDTPNGSGPYKLKEWKKNDVLLLERNDAYYLGAANIKNIVFQLTGNPVLMYERGEIDVASVSLSSLEKVQDTTSALNKDLISCNQNDVAYLNFNNKMPPFDDANVRKAFAMAIDANKIIEVSMKGTATRAAGFVPPGVPGNNPDSKPMAFDPAQAKQLIANSKYGSVDKLPAVTLSVIGASSQRDDAMVAMWKQNLGVTVNIQVVNEAKDWYDRYYRHDLQLCIRSWRADYLDPQNFLELFFLTGSNENSAAYSNPDVDKALKGAASESDSAARITKYQQIEKIVLSELPDAPLYWGRRSYALVKPYVKGYALYPTAVNLWKDLSLGAH